MGEPIRSYKDLIAWQKAYALGIALYYFTSRFPEHERFGLTASIRRSALLLARQIAYMNEQWPGSQATNLGLFGLSAGEAGLPGAGYTANGVDLPGIRWIHPHAMVMALALSGGNTFGDGVRRLEQAGLLFPQGLPENVEISLTLHNPMQGSLNAAFETLASYHGWRRGKNGTDVIDQACLNDPLMRKGAARFFKPAVGP